MAGGGDELTPARRLLITGAGGALGSLLVRSMRSRYQLRVTTLERKDDGLFDGLDVRYSSLTDFRKMISACEGIDTVVHLGARSLEDQWPEISSSNIEGTYVLFEAARRQGVKRIIFASSHHVGGFHRRERVTGPMDSLRPDSLYAVSKIFGEALGRLYVDKHGMSVICQRIGVCRATPPHRRALWAWLSERDFVELTVRCIEAQDVRFLIVYGVSKNSRKQWANPGASVISFVAQDDAESFVGRVPNLSEEPDFEARFQGGAFCAQDFSSRQPVLYE